MANKIKSLKLVQGFTLLEVLVASAILFSAIAITSLIFKSSYVASEKAQQRVEQAGVLPALLIIVQEDIREQTAGVTDALKNHGVIWGMPYRWQAKLSAFKAPPEKFDTDTGTMESYKKRYKLWQVDLSLGEGKKRLDFQYYEISWLRE